MAANNNNAMTAEHKEYLIAKALESPQGREALAQVMANPIRTSLDYQGIARKLFVVDPLPQGALPIYDKDVDARAFIISKRGAVPDQIIEGDRLQIPTFEIASYPQVRFSQVKERRFNIIDRSQQRARADIMAVEDETAFQLIEAACGVAGSVNPVTTATSLNRQALKDAFKEVEKHDRMS